MGMYDSQVEAKVVDRGPRIITKSTREKAPGARANSKEGDSIIQTIITFSHGFPAFLDPDQNQSSTSSNKSTKSSSSSSSKTSSNSSSKSLSSARYLSKQGQPFNTLEEYRALQAALAAKPRQHGIRTGSSVGANTPSSASANRKRGRAEMNT